MAQSRGPQRKGWIKMVCWLCLPVIGFSIWMTTAWMMDWVLSDSSGSSRRLQAGFYPEAQLDRTLTIHSIYVNLNYPDEVADVTLKTTNSTLERLEFKFLLTRKYPLERILANELNSTPDSIRSLIDYSED